MKVEIVNAEVLKIGPGETLLVRFPEAPDLREQDHRQIFAEFARCGIPPNRLIIMTGDVEWAKVSI